MISLKELVALTDTPAALLFLSAGILLSCITNFPQLRKLKQFFKIISSKDINISNKNTITPLQALFTAMSTSLGMGTIVAPPLAIAIGGPGALFWIVVYSFFASVTKFAEVTFAVKFKRYAQDGTIIGGPTAYLWQIHPYLADWYGFLTILLFSSWTALQAKSMAATYEHYAVPEYVTGFIMALFVFFMLTGGAKRIGEFSSKLVPFMCTIYFILCSFIVVSDLTTLQNACISIITHAFSPTAPIGAFAGATILSTMRQGIFKSAFITEAGVGTAAIPHALADTDKPTNQGILAMYSIVGDTFFCIMSGLVTLVSGVWKLGKLSNDLPLLAFKAMLPTIGPIAYTIAVTLFIIGTAVGNSLNGSKSFAFFTNNQFMKAYYAFVSICIFCGAVFEAPTLWNVSDLILPMIAIPNIIGVLVLSLRYRKELSI
ncbi:MAG: hypothetical protein CL947_04540 [Epsilonproteobacteria bacterium]|nr:hypothetical protein [Campylobacterota bacterium]|tara:strand:- start:1304 stop:2593 length:1290 start_codon:yes stop_codon:yes gene_type:complete